MNILRTALHCCLAALPAMAGEPLTPFSNTPSSDVGRISDVVQQIQKALNDVPGDVQRLAVYQFKSDSREFRPGVVRYLQGRVEESFSTEGRRTLVNSPELKTIRVSSTDSTFSVSNTLPSTEELWKLAEKLRVDAFLEGSVTRSPDNDLLLTLRLFKAKTGDLVWSGSFVSGPSKGDSYFPDLDFALYAGLRIFPLDRFKSDDSTSFGSTYMVTNFDLEASATEPITADKRFELGISAGYTHLSVRGTPDSIGSPPDVHLFHLGAELDAVFFRKADPRDGYWLGTYVGYDDFLPLLQRQHFGAFRFGYRSRPTRHFTLGAGVLFIPFGNHMTDSPGSGGRTFDLGRIAYEINFLHYTF